MNQGTLFDDLPEANSKYEASQLSNQSFCEEIEESLLALGYREVKDTPSLNEYVRNAPYKDMYGGIRKAAFLIQHRSFGAIRVEAHKQEQSGSVDQKFPFFLESLRNAPESNLIILLGGGGYKKQAFDWVNSAACKVQEKQVKVFGNLVEFRMFLTSK